jgi:hypothetical protein
MVDADRQRHGHPRAFRVAGRVVRETRAELLVEPHDPVVQLALGVGVAPAPPQHRPHGARIDGQHHQVEAHACHHHRDSEQPATAEPPAPWLLKSISAFTVPAHGGTFPSPGKPPSSAVHPSAGSVHAGLEQQAAPLPPAALFHAKITSQRPA